MFDRILAVLDEPDRRDPVLGAALRLARADGARLDLLQAVPFLETIAEMPHELSPQRVGDDEAAEVWIDALVASLRAEGIEAEGFTDIGRSALMIAAAAERIDASLIAIRALPARRVRALIDLTPIPVLIVPATSASTGPGQASGRVLVPLDGEEPSMKVVPVAIALARTSAVGITFVPVGPVRWESMGHTAVERAREEGVEADLVEGDVLRLVRSLPAGWIVLRPADGWTSRLWRESPVPVLAARRALRPSAARPPVLDPPRVLWTRRTPPNPIEGVGEPWQ